MEDHETRRTQVKAALMQTPPGSLTMLVKKFGLAEPDAIQLHTGCRGRSPDCPSRIHAGDPEGVLKGTRLDQVIEMEARGAYFKPESLSRENQQDKLTLVSDDPAASALFQPEESILLHVTLKDGRVLDLKSTVALRRPSVSVISKSVQYDETPAPVVRLETPMSYRRRRVSIFP